MDVCHTHINLLGPPRATHQGQPVNFRYRKSWSLLGLIVASGNAWSRARLAATFWPDNDGPTARTNLRALLSDINRNLPEVLTVTREHVERNAQNQASYDMDALEAWLARPTTDPSATFTQPLLEGADIEGAPDFDVWLREKRESLDLKLLQAFHQNAAAALQNDREHDARRALEHAAAIAPWDEAAQHLHARLLLRAGKVAAARAVITQTCTAAAAHLDVEPSPETQQLELLARSVAGRTQIGEAAYVGGHTAIIQAAETLATHGTLTVTGTPASGRSRFAAAVALEAAAVHGPAHVTVRDGANPYTLKSASSGDTHWTVTVHDTGGTPHAATVAPPPLDLPPSGTSQLEGFLKASAGRLIMHGHEGPEPPPGGVAMLTHMARLLGGSPGGLTYLAEIRDRFLTFPTALLDTTATARFMSHEGRPNVAERIRRRLQDLPAPAQSLLHRLTPTLSGLHDHDLRDVGATEEELQHAKELERLGWLQPTSQHRKRRRLEGMVHLVLHADAADAGNLPPHPHHDRFVAYLLGSDDALRGAEQAATLRFFREHVDDVLQAITQAGHGDAELGLQVATSAWHLARRTGHVHLIAGHLEALLQDPGSDDRLLLANAESALANLWVLQGRAAEAYQTHERLLSDLADHPPTGEDDALVHARIRGRSALTLAQIDARAGRSDTAYSRLDEVDALPDAPELAWFHASAMVNRGFVLKSEGRHAEAFARLSAGAKTFWGLQDTMGEAAARIGALATAGGGGDETSALRQQEALALCFERMEGHGLEPLAAPLADAARDLERGGFTQVSSRLKDLYEQVTATAASLDA